MENSNPNPAIASSTSSTISDEVKKFYKNDFKELFLTVVKNPIDGVFHLFKNPTKDAYKNALILYCSVFVFFLIGIYIIAGESRGFLEFSDFMKLSLVPVIFMFTITLLSFAIKSFSGKPDFKNELQTGAISGIPVAFLVPILLILKIALSIDNVFVLVRNPAGVGVFGFIVLLYIVMMFINIFQQSLKASGTKDAVAWYLSPLAIFGAFYITDMVIESMF
ncbi:YIP1 family protein [Algoriphagus sp.]|uniref:YIP1 family protein n=1 Tax=Algoriphagus sp. TaxID=1872435 RepID=UPI003F6F28B1